MYRSVRFIGYLALLVGIAAVALSGPVAWATTEQSNLNQTVPTRTPPSPPRPPDPNPEPPSPPQPTDPTAQPQVTPPAGATATPALPAATSTSIAGARLALEKRADRDQAWPGVTLLYTLTLSNIGAASARQVVIEDVLPPGLEPGAIVAGSGAVWNQRTLRAQAPVLPPGGKYTVSFTARVASDAGPGPALINQATAMAAGGLTARAVMAAALPPVELPPVGADLTGGARDEGAGR